MSDTSPPPPSSAPPPGWTWPPPGGPQPYPAQPTGRRGLTVVVLAVVLTLVVGGGAFAFFRVDPFHLFRPGPQAAEALPASAVLYAAVDLDPTAGQKIDALRFLNHFPGFRESAGLADPEADVREVLITKMLTSEHCAGVDYGRDIEPWLGERFGAAVFPPTTSEQQPFAVAVQVSDEAAARQGIVKLNRCGSQQDAPGVAFDNGYLLLSKTQADADAFASEAERHALADDPDFKADMDSLGDQGVMTTWVDVKGAVTAFGGTSAQTQQVDALTGVVQRVAATVRFGSDHIEVASSIYGNTPAVEHDDNPVVRLPDSTVFAFSESGADQRIAQAWKSNIDRARAADPGIDQQIAQLEAQTGLSLPADLTTLFGHNLLLAMDKQGLSADVLQGGDPSLLNIGARLTNDPAKLNALYSKLVDAIRPGLTGELPFVKRSFPDGIAVATNGAYAETLGRLDGSLGDTDAFRSVVDDAAGKEYVMFFNLDAVKQQVLESLTREGAPQELIDNMRPLRAFGISADVSGHYEHVTVRLSVDD